MGKQPRMFFPAEPDVYRYMEDLLKLDACRPPSNWRTNENLSGSVSPLRWEVWDDFLESYPDQRFRDYIVDGIRAGFRVGFNYTRAKLQNETWHRQRSIQT